MGRKPQRRTFRRPSPQQRNEDTAREQQRLDSAAQSLVATTTTEELRAVLQEREWLLTEADRAAQLDPNPANLSRYRYARTQYNVARAALELADRAS
jgi:hypothetical protein